MATVRLQKYLAGCGVASRRGAEQLIADGRVAVNGVVVREMGAQVEPTDDQVTVDGKLVSGEEHHVYYILHKPVGVISAASDDRGRQTVVDLLSGVEERVYPVGRLDYTSSGLVLLTNDGELAAHLMHPRYHVPKVYQVVVEGQPTPATVRKLATGVRLEDGITLPARVEVVDSRQRSTELRIELREGRNRQIRRMCTAVGHAVIHLCRLQIGPLSLGNLQAGEWRRLTPPEVEQLRYATLAPQGTM